MNDTTELQLHHVLAAPLAALVRAEAISAMALLDFISTVGFQAVDATAEKSSDNFGEMRMVSFRYQRQQADGSVRQMTMQVPVLALIPLPVLNVKDSSFTFDVALTALRLAPTQQTKPGIAALAGLPEAELHVALPPVASSDGSSTPTPPMMNVHINAVRGDFPNGIINLLQLVNTGVVTQDDLASSQPPHPK